ncbi:MAG: hypothetical protein A2663_04345 [Candidatus Buchananbacteria bacterium RIFCSPHIGHO2_01_FULL_46_12]|uniref:Uncharacterized protein n=1 Tax=Candidatus Buchananbacteria bacterium RIFCSPHIGHO2_01_FULL_46_12 TaxID=1797536 RepID=A0A1G1Y320_9BACT|nr:MAG: hypothetical protein A2663_04345 [Candidatus Buchananbacteria bacterium RIFCSPHIGHO2_01_FULL_46_12]
MKSKDNPCGSPLTYTALEKAGLSALGILAVFLLAGWGLCYLSFEGERLVHPKLNLAGLIILLILPASASLIFGLCRQISDQSVFKHYQEIWEKFFLYMPFAILVAIFHSSDQGYMPLKINVILVLSWAAASAGIYHLNHFLRRVCQTENTK